VIASVALPSTQTARFTIASIVFGVIITILDLFIPSSLSAPADQQVTLSISIILALIFIFVLLSRFRFYSLRVKFIILFVLVALTSITAVVIGVNTTIRKTLTQRRVTMPKPGHPPGKTRLVLNWIHKLTSCGLTPRISRIRPRMPRRVIRVRMRNPGKLADSRPLVAIAWRQCSTDPGVLTNSMAEKNCTNSKVYPQPQGNLCTDQYGANIAATDRTTNYFHGNEDWWKAAYNNGKGAVYMASQNSIGTQQPMAQDWPSLFIAMALLSVSCVHLRCDRTRPNARSGEIRPNGASNCASENLPFWRASR